MASLLSVFESEISKDGKVINDAWQDEGLQRLALMRYLPRSGDLDPQQINIAVHAALFSTTFSPVDSDETNDTMGANSRSKKLWSYAFVCLFDQASNEIESS